MRAWLRRWGWPIGKGILAVAICVAIGRQFLRDLQGLSLSDVSLRPGWLVLSGAAYALALGCSAFYWYRLLYAFQQRPAFLPALRAYYIGLLGKYLPGKAWALFMRGSLIAGPDVLVGVAIITAFYEVFTTMAAGALLAAVLFALQPPAATDLTLSPVAVGALLVAILGVPLLPGVFNRLVGRLARRFQNVESFRLPRLRLPTLLEGLAIVGCGWVCFGISLWACLQGFLEVPYPLTPEVLGRYVAIMGLAYVAGFLIFVIPSGLVVREFILQRYLAPQLARQGLAAAGPVVLLAVILLRLVWTATEVFLAGAVYWFPSGARVPKSKVRSQRSTG